MKELKLKIETLTSLWTGDVATRMHCIHETGILGILSWWYEAIAQGLGDRHVIQFRINAAQIEMTTTAMYVWFFGPRDCNGRFGWKDLSGGIKSVTAASPSKSITIEDSFWDM